MFHHNHSTMHSTFGPSSTRNGFIPNDENVIPIQQQQKKHLSTMKGSSSSSLSSSMSALKSKKGNALQSINSNSTNMGSFPKTPLSSSTTKKGHNINSNTSRRRALGDISNRKGSNGFASSSSKSNTISKGNTNSVSFHIHDASSANTKKNKSTKKKKKPLSSSSISINNINRNGRSTSSNVKKKSVMFQDEIYDENYDNINTLKIPQQQLPKKNKSMMKSKSTNALKRPSFSSSRRMTNLSTELDYVDDFEVSFCLPQNKDDILQDDLYIGNIDDCDKLPEFEKHEKMREEKYWLQHEKEFEETMRKGNEIMAKKIEMIQNTDHEEDNFYLKVFEEDDFSDDLNIYNNEEEDNIPYYNGLDDLSI